MIVAVHVANRMPVKKRLVGTLLNDPDAQKKKSVHKCLATPHALSPFLA
jgi:hypothetical protein